MLLKRLNVVSGELASDDTSQFVLRFDDIFDSVNGHEIYSKKLLKSAITSQSPHMAFYQDSISWLKTFSISRYGKNISSNVLSLNNGFIGSMSLKESSNSLKAGYRP